MSESGAEVIARRLAAKGCRFAFGIPGGEVLALIDALDRAGIRFIVTRHENGAGFAAEGTWHATGAPGVLVATVGPGAANAANVVANAQQDRVPLIVLTGAFEAREALSYTHQVFDHRALFAPITKASLIAPARAVEVAIERAIAIATEPPHGPVHVDVPIEVATAIEPGGAAPEVPVVRGRPRPDDPRFVLARETLSRAERPLVLVGLEVLDRAEADLRALVDAGGLPVVTTYKAKGVIDERDPRVVGAAGLSPRADAILAPLVRDADVIVLAGYDPIEMRKGWRDPFGSAFVIDVCARAPQHGMHRAEVALVGDVAATIGALAGPTSITDSWRERCASARRMLADAFAPEPSGWGPMAIAHAARRALPDDVVLTVDTGAHRIALAHAFEARRSRAFLQSSGLATMGCGVPLAIGYALAAPGARVVAFVGDGGLDMSLGELATARDAGVSIAVVVIDDSSLELIALKQRADRWPSLGVHLGATDYAGLARAFGLRGERIEDAASLERALRQPAPGITVLHCPIPRGSYDGRI